MPWGDREDRPRELFPPPALPDGRAPTVLPGDITVGSEVHFLLRRTQIVPYLPLADVIWTKIVLYERLFLSTFSL